MIGSVRLRLDGEGKKLLPVKIVIWGTSKTSLTIQLLVIFRNLKNSSILLESKLNQQINVFLKWEINFYYREN